LKVTLLRDAAFPMPTVSVCIPTFSRHDYLKEAIHSAISQIYDPVEILVGDDGCSSAIERVAFQFQRDPRVRYWRNEANLGLAGNWNGCVERARGEYLIIIGDDDRLLPRGIADLVTAGSEDVIFGTHLLIDAKGAPLQEETRINDKVWGRSCLATGPVQDRESMVWKGSVPICGAIIKTALAKRFKFKEDTNAPELILFAELAATGATFRYVNTVVSEYRVHAQSETNSGLWNDRLAKYLIDIPVSPRTEQAKRTLLRPLLVNAVSRCLAQSKVEEACAFVSSEYYPRSIFGPRPLVQRAILSLPPRHGLRLFRLIMELNRHYRQVAASIFHGLRFEARNRFAWLRSTKTT
jgi:glycosyltransferase involved in cell wall biosynthesis